MLFSVAGRIPRPTFWYYQLVTLGIFLASLALDITIDTFEPDIGYGWLTGILTLLLLYPWVMVSIKRLHDRNHPGAFLILSIVPFINFWLLYELYFLPGTDGGNM